MAAADQAVSIALEDGQEVRLTPEVLDELHLHFQEAVKSSTRGHPVVLGVLQILTGILITALAACLSTSVFPFDYFIVLILGGVSLVFITSGGLSIESGRRPSLARLKVAFGMNIVSCLGAIAAGISFTVLTAFQRPWNTPIGTGILSFITVLHFLEASVTITSLCFGSRALCLSRYNVLPVVYVQKPL